MKKILLAIILFQFLITATYAVNLNPASGSFAAGSSSTINLTAVPNGSNQNVVVIRLQASNLTFTNYTAPSGGGWTVINPDCTGSVFFTSTDVCVTLGKTTDIIAGESLGSIGVTFGSAGSATITKVSGNSYSDGSIQTPDLGTAGNYIVSSGSPTPTSSTLPGTALGDGNFLSYATGVLLILSGVFFLQKRKSVKFRH